MGKELTIEHVAPYLGHQLQFYGTNNGEIYSDTMTGLSKSGDTWFVEGLTYHDYLFAVKPVLKPLSWLTNEIEHNGEKFVPTYLLGWNSYDHIIKKGICTGVSYQYMIKLFKWHFDVFGLIEAGLAIEEGGKQ